MSSRNDISSFDIPEVAGIAYDAMSRIQFYIS
jgi:hypothetical protein